MIDKKLVKKAYQGGAFTILMEVLKEMQQQDQDFTFDPDPYQNAYNLGKRDKMKDLVSEIENNIKYYCN
jgi:hypothetical protein